MPDPKKTGEQLNREAYQRSLAQAKKELAQEYVQKNMKEVTGSTLWNLPGNIYAGIPKYGINLGKGAFNAIKHQTKMLGLAQGDNLITEGIDFMGKKYNEKPQSKYADGGNLTRFNEGGTHEQNPLGGVPQGQAQNGTMNTVEQGETKMGSYIYSDRISLNPDMIKQFNLPKYAAGKSVADASKAIEDKFKDRNDKYANETKVTLLKRLEQAQETHKAEQAQMQGAMDANAQQGPEDMMGGQVPEGMEEFAGGEPQIAPEEAQPTPMAAYGGYQTKRFDEGGDLDPVTGLRIPVQGLAPMQSAGVVRMPNAMPTASAVPTSAGKPAIGADAAGGGGGPSAGGIAAAAGTVMDLGKTAFGKAEQDITGTEASGRVSGASMIGGSAIKGAAMGAQIGGPWGAAIGGVVGGAAGVVGLGKARKAEALNTQRFATNTNKKFSDQYANGGAMEGPGKKVRNADGSYSMVTSNTVMTPGVAGHRIPGTPGSPAVLGTKGVNSPDQGRNKAFAAARTAGLPNFKYNGKLYSTEMSGTPARAAVPATPDIVTPSSPATYRTEETITPLDSEIYDVRATRGTIGGARRDGVGGSISTGHQVTQNKEMADRTMRANDSYNKDLIARYSPDTENLRGLNPAQLANKNAKAAQRLIDLKGTASVTETSVPMGLERDAVASRKQFALGGDLEAVSSLTPVVKGTEFAKANVVAPREAYNGNMYVDKAKLMARDAGKAINENAGEAMRYAPIVANMLQAKNLKAPTGVQYATLENRYKPRYADEAQLQTAVGQASNNTINAVSQSGGSEGAQRAAILGVGANATRGLSDAYLQANAQNASQDATAQQFNLGVDSANVATKNRGIDEMRMDEAAYRGAKSKLLAQMGTDIGSIGKEQADAQLAGALTGYTRKGKYLYKPDGSKVSPSELAKITNIHNPAQGATPTLKKGDKYIDEKGVTQTFNFGGYLNTKKTK